MSLTKEYGPIMFYLANTKQHSIMDFVKILCDKGEVKQYKALSDSFIFVIFNNQKIDDSDIVFKFGDKYTELKKVYNPNFAGFNAYFTKWSDGDTRYSDEYVREICTGTWIDGKTGKAITHATTTSSEENTFSI